MKKMKVCVVEYETSDSTLWKAVILAFTIEDAVRYIYSVVPGTRKIVSTQTYREVDAIEPKVYDAYFTKIEETVIRQEPINNKEPVNQQTKPEKVENIFDDTKQKNEPVYCDICGKEFKNENGLMLHKNKMHKN